MNEQLKLLCIDDDKLIQSVIKKALGPSHQLVFAESGKTGIDMAKAERPDIIILDIEMPDMNGYEACRLLKGSPDTASIPIIFISSLADLRSRMIGFDVGGSDFLVKPFEAKELSTKIETIGRLTRTNEELKFQAEDASKTALIAMRSSSDQGLAINYIERSFSVLTEKELAETFLASTNSLDLSATLLFSTPNGQKFFFKQ